eukprot:gene10352-biopygen4043
MGRRAAYYAFREARGYRGLHDDAFLRHVARKYNFALHHYLRTLAVMRSAETQHDMAERLRVQRQYGIPRTVLGGRRLGTIDILSRATHLWMRICATSLHWRRPYEMLRDAG